MQLADENDRALDLVQAMLGLITPNFRMVTLEVRDAGGVTLNFLLQTESAADREEIADIVFEFEALQDRIRDVQVRVFVDDRPLETVEFPPGRRVFARRENEYPRDG